MTEMGGRRGGWPQQAGHGQPRKRQARPRGVPAPAAATRRRGRAAVLPAGPAFLSLSSRILGVGFPGGSVVKNVPAWRHGFDP